MATKEDLKKVMDNFIDPETYKHRKNNLKYNIEITNCYKEMLEEGGIPQISYNELNRKQIYVLYLISNIVISEAYKAQGHIKDKMIQGDMNIKEFKKIMEVFNE